MATILPSQHFHLIYFHYWLVIKHQTFRELGVTLSFMNKDSNFVNLSFQYHIMVSNVLIPVPAPGQI